MFPVCWDKVPNVKKPYAWLPGVPLESQIPVLCQYLQVQGSVEDYCASMNDTVLTDDYVKSFLSKPPELVVLQVKPDIQARQLLEALTSGSPVERKKALFDIGKYLQLGGMKNLSSLVQEEQGNSLAYALSAMDIAMEVSFGEDISKEAIHKIVSLFDTQQGNVRAKALSIASKLATSKKYGYPAVHAAITSLKSTTGQAYQWIVTNLHEQDLDVKLNAMRFINQFVEYAPNPIQLLAELEQSNLTKVLQLYLSSKITEEFIDMIVKFQQIRFNAMVKEKDTPFDDKNPEHQRMLSALWSATFPHEALTGRISSQWGKLGFQGTDPATDFRGMGVAGLRILLYAAQVHTDTFRGIVLEQNKLAAVGTGHDYPVAVASINVANFLMGMFGKILKDDPNHLIPIFFDHPCAFEEMCTQTLAYLDKVYIAMKAQYMDFPIVLAKVKERCQEFVAHGGKTVVEFRNWMATEVSSDKKKEKDKKKEQKKEKKANAKANRKGQVGPEAKPSNHLELGVLDPMALARLVREGKVSVDAVASDSTKMSPLHRAVLDNNLDLVRLLLWRDAEVDVLDATGWTPLHLACDKASLDIIELLLDKGAKVNLITQAGNLCAHYILARSFDNEERSLRLTRVLLAGADLTAMTTSGENLAHYAALSPKPFAGLQLLHSMGVPLNIRNRRGNAPLHNAIFQGNIEAFAALLELGVDPNLQDGKGQTPAQLCQGNPIMLAMLQNPTAARSLISAYHDGKKKGSEAAKDSAVALLEEALQNRDRVQNEHMELEELAAWQGAKNKLALIYQTCKVLLK